METIMRICLDQIKQMQFAALLFFFLVSGGHSVQFTITNNCPYQIWPATLGTPAASSTGFPLDQGATYQIDVPNGWVSGRVWARTHCTTNNGQFTCETGDCGSGQIPCNGNSGAKPATLVEMTLNGDNNQDTYDISLVDGFNVPVAVAPQGQGCTRLDCGADVNAACPAHLQIKDAGGALIACNSTCTASNNQPQYCCTGDYQSADACQRTDYTDMAKQQCPQAYSFAADDATSTFRCAAGSGYAITFCP